MWFKAAPEKIVQEQPECVSKRISLIAEASMETLVIAHQSSSPEITLNATLQHGEIPLASSGDLFVNLRAALPPDQPAKPTKPATQADIVFLIDTSGSMLGEAKNGASKIDTLKTVLHELLTSMSSRSTSPGVNMTFVDMVSLGVIVNWFDISDKSAVQSVLASIKKLRANGNERPDDALKLMCATIKTRDIKRQDQVVSSTCIVLSDGQGGYELNNFLPHYNAIVQSKPVTLYGIGFGQDVEAAKLTATALHTGGRFCFGDTGSDIKFIFEDLVSRAQAVVCSRKMTIAPGQHVSTLRLHTEFPPFQKDTRLMGKEQFDLGNASVGSETNILLRAELATCTSETKQHIATVKVQFNNSAGKTQMAGVDVFVRRIQATPGVPDVPSSAEFTTPNPVQPPKNSKSNGQVLRQLACEIVRFTVQGANKDKAIVERAKRVIGDIPSLAPIKQEMNAVLDKVKEAKPQVLANLADQLKHPDGMEGFLRQQLPENDEKENVLDRWKTALDDEEPVELDDLEQILEMTAVMEDYEDASRELEEMCDRLVKEIEAVRKEAEAKAQEAKEQHERELEELKTAKDKEIEALKQQNEELRKQNQELTDEMGPLRKRLAAYERAGEAMAKTRANAERLREKAKLLEAQCLTPHPTA